MEVTVIPIVIGALATVTKRLIKGPEDFEMRAREENIQNYSIFKIGQNTEKSPGGLLSLILQWETIS